MYSGLSYIYIYLLPCNHPDSSFMSNVCFVIQGSHEQINPSLIIPIGPDIDYSIPHDRATRFQ